jgi:hypothetical protein
LHVKGIEPEITEQQLREFFGGDDSGVCIYAGCISLRNGLLLNVIICNLQIDNVRFIQDHRENVRRDFAYVDFADEEKLMAGLGKNLQVKFFQQLIRHHTV